MGRFLGTIADRFLIALQYKDYRTLWTANLLAGASAWALIVARAVLAYEITGYYSWAGLVVFAAMIPRLVATPLIGFIADRFDRQTVLSWTYALNLLHNVALAILVMTGLIGPILLIALAFFNGTLRASQMTATQSLVPNLVPKEHLLNAVALNQATQQGSRAIGPLAITPIVLFVSLEWAFWLCGLFYLIGLIQTLRIQTRSTGTVDQRKSVTRNIFDGFSYVYSTPIVLAMILFAVFHCTLTMSYESLLPAMSEIMSDSGNPDHAVLLMSGIGVGALISSVLLAGVRTDAIRGRVFLILGLTSGLTYVALGLSSMMELALLFTILLGASTAGFMTVTHTVIQAVVPDGVRGRVSGIYSMHVGGSMAFANLLNGVLADVFNAPVVMTVTGCSFLGLSILSVIYKPLRNLYFPRIYGSESPSV